MTGCTPSRSQLSPLVLLMPLLSWAHGRTGEPLARRRCGTRAREQASEAGHASEPRRRGHVGSVIVNVLIGDDDLALDVVMLARDDLTLDAIVLAGDDDLALDVATAAAMPRTPRHRAMAMLTALLPWWPVVLDLLWASPI